MAGVMLNIPWMTVVAPIAGGTGYGGSVSTNLWICVMDAPENRSLRIKAILSTVFCFVWLIGGIAIWCIQ